MIMISAVIINRKHRDDLAGLFSRLHVDDALAAARLQPISRDRRLLAITLLGNGKHLLLVLCRDGADRNDVIILSQVDAARAAGRPAHRPHVLLVKANRQAVVSRDEDALGAVGQDHVKQLIAFVDIDGDDAVRCECSENQPARSS